MSQKTIDDLIGRLFSDEDLRERFLRDPLGMLSAWLTAGFTVTAADIDALIQAQVTRSGDGDAVASV